MKSNHSLYKICAIFLSLSISLIAQQTSEQEQVSCKVDLVSLGENIPGLYLGKKKGKSVNALAFRYDETLKYKGDRVILISQGYTKVATPPLSKEDEEQESVPLKRKDRPEVESSQKDEILQRIVRLRKKNPDLVAIAKVPAGSKHITILLSPAPSNTYKALVFNDDSNKMPYGKLKIHNFCKHPIAMKFAGAKPAILKQDTSHGVNPKNQSVSYLLSYPKKGKWKAQESNIIRVTPDQQVRMIILNSESSFFQSGNGSRGGHLQVAFLKRDRTVKPSRPEDSIPKEGVPDLPDGFKKK